MRQYAAQQDPKIFPDPQTLELDQNKRKLENYLVYGRPLEKNRFGSKDLTIIAIMGLVKHAATMKRIRRAHDQAGKLKVVETPGPNSQRRYLTPRWDTLVSFPTSKYRTCVSGLAKVIS